MAIPVARRNTIFVAVLQRCLRFPRMVDIDIGLSFLIRKPSLDSQVAQKYDTGGDYEYQINNAVNNRSLSTYST